MALGTIGAALAGGAVKAGVGFGLSKLFGGKSGSDSISSFQPTGFSAGGLNASFGPGGASVSSNAARQSLVGGLASTFPKQAQQISNLRGLVAPGFGALTRSRLATVGDTARRTIGNLRDNLSRRRVLGSSFAEDAVTRAEAEFGRESDRVVAESFLQELDMTNQLLQQEFETRRGEFTTQLDELNLQAEIAGNLSSSASSQLASNAQLKARLLASESAGAGRFFGQAFQPALDALGKNVSDRFIFNPNLSQIGANFAASTTVT